MENLEGVKNLSHLKSFYLYVISSNLHSALRDSLSHGIDRTSLRFGVSLGKLS